MLPLKIQRFLPDRQEPSLAPKLLPVSHVNFIFNFVPHVIYSLGICTFAITKFINKILRNQIQYRYISKQVVMLSDIDGDCQLKVTKTKSNWLALSVSVTLRLIFILILQVRESASSQRSQE